MRSEFCDGKYRCAISIGSLPYLNSALFSAYLSVVMPPKGKHKQKDKARAEKSSNDGINDESSQYATSDKIASTSTHNKRRRYTSPEQPELSAERLGELLDEAIKTEGDAELAVIYLMHQYNFDLTRLKNLLTCSFIEFLCGCLDSEFLNCLPIT
jgi:hypothetical protein